MQPARNDRRRPATHRLRFARGVALACVLGLASVSGLTAPAGALEPTSAIETEAPAAESSWQVLEVVADGFRGLLPQDETWQEHGLRKTYAGTVEETKYFGRTEGRTFSIGLHVLPSLGRFFAPTSLVLKHAKKNVMRTNGGQEVSYERRRFGDHPGALLTLSPTDADADWHRMEVKLVLVGERLYILKASDPGEGEERVAADRFFDSFEVIE